jgi:mono/diheme cytochrome c family protein
MTMGKAAHRTSLACLALILGTALTGCGSARRSEPIAGPLPISDSQVARGKVVFMRHCNQCHSEGEAALGPALNNFPAPPFLVRFQIREGLGAMPAFPPDKISEPELDALISYILAMRAHR